ncbi:MAG: putative undecaprenyl-phosphate galactose phosphotransferase [Bacteroidota bacterium]
MSNFLLSAFLIFSSSSSISVTFTGSSLYLPLFSFAKYVPAGYFLRKYKLDELPQLLNVLIGSMSLVGPRPEVRKYVDLYNTAQQNVLSVKPGITDYASIEYSEENDLLAKSNDPERTYIDEIMPAKLLLNQKYIAEKSLTTDIKIIWLTFKKIISH